MAAANEQVISSSSVTDVKDLVFGAFCGESAAVHKPGEFRAREECPEAVVFLCFLTSTLAAQGKLAATPPMGWNSWNHFAERVDDETIRATADALVSTGLRDAGYIYLNIDDTWEGKRDTNSLICSSVQPAP